MDGREDGFRFASFILAGICLAVFAASSLAPYSTVDLWLVSTNILSNPISLVTHIFVHGDELHLIYNLFSLLLFGTILEHFIGWKKFMIVFFGSGVAAGIGGSIFYAAIIGASGAIFGVMGCLAAIKPRLVVWTIGAPMPMVVAAVFFAALDFLLFSASDGIAHASHLIGMGVGVIIGLEMRARMPRPEKEKDNYSLGELTSDREFDEWERRYMMAGE